MRKFSETANLSPVTDGNKKLKEKKLIPYSFPKFKL